MTLDTLIGEKITLVGYTKEFEIVKGGYYGNASCFIIVFKHDSNEYIMKIQEDPSDGYRSCLGEISFVDRKDEDFKNSTYTSLPPAKVIVNFKDTGSLNEWSLTDEFGEKWFTFGTSNVDDYYPSYFYTEPSNYLKSWREAKLGNILDD